MRKLATFSRSPEGLSIADSPCLGRKLRVETKWIDVVEHRVTLPHRVTLTWYHNDFYFGIDLAYANDII